jgi:hypothetical protein
LIRIKKIGGRARGIKTLRQAICKKFVVKNPNLKDYKNREMAVKKKVEFAGFVASNASNGVRFNESTIIRNIFFASTYSRGLALTMADGQEDVTLSQMFSMHLTRHI